MTTYRDMTIEHLGTNAERSDLLAFQEACEAVLPYFQELAVAGLLDVSPDEAATDYIFRNGDFGPRLNAGACIYCSALVADRTEVPDVSDDAAWARLSVEHAASMANSDGECEWIETRAHRCD